MTSSIEVVAQKYRGLRCTSIADGLVEQLKQADANEVSYLEFADQLVEYEQKRRNRKRVELNRRKANFPATKRLEEFDYRHQTTITKRQVNQLLDFSFLDERTNLVFIGPPGVGKSHLAIGIGHQAIEAGYKVLFSTAMSLVEMLELAELKGELKKRIAALQKFDLLIIDGSPGIGCPVIASITGADLVLVVTEPTLSGLHDLGRVAQLTKHFGIQTLVCVNKWDLNAELATEIESNARPIGVEAVGRIRYDRAVTEAQINGQALVEYTETGAAEDIKGLWSRVSAKLGDQSPLKIL